MRLIYIQMITGAFTILIPKNHPFIPQEQDS